MTDGLTLSELVLEVTNACGYRCVHCSTFGGSPLENELTQEERLRVVREAAGLGMKEFRLLGGDPLLRMEDTLGLLKEASRLGVSRANICTSATLPSADWITLLREIDPIQLSADASIYSTNPKIHDEITKSEGSLLSLLASSRVAVRAGFELNWNFVWMKPNFYELPAIVRLASEIGIKQVRVLRLMMNGRAKENRSLLEVPPTLELECDQILRTIETECPEVQLVFSKPLTFQLKDSRYRAAEPCGAGRGQLVIEADGSVVPCIGMKGVPEFQLGNIRQASLKDIFSTGKNFGISELSQKLHRCPAVMLQNGEPLATGGANLQEEVKP